MKKICVYTCITGNYDYVHEIEKKEKGIYYYLFTNNKNLKSKTWNIVYIEDQSIDDFYLSRKIKMLGHDIINNNYDICVWQDASVTFKKSVREFVEKYLKKNSFAAFRHYARNCIYEEAKECLRLKKDNKDNIIKTINFLKSEKFPYNYGLCEMTVFIKKCNDPVVKKTMEDWFYMICNYSKRDQLSFMYCVWKNNLQIDYIDLSVWENEFIINHKHRYKNYITSCRIYYGCDLDFNIDCCEIVEYKVQDNKYIIQTKVLNDTNVIELEITDIPCIKYSDFEISNNVDNIYFYNSIKLDGNDYFYSDSGIIKLEGNFKKNQSLKFSIELYNLDDNEKLKFIEDVSINLLKSEEKKQRLENENIVLRNEINAIINSKSWRMTAPLRKISKKQKT